MRCGPSCSPSCAREITVAAKIGHARSVDERAPAPGGQERQGRVACPRTTSSAPSTRPSAATPRTTKRSATKAMAPAASRVIVEALTDNRNRSASNVRAAFTKNGGALGETDSVSFMWDRVGEIYYPPPRPASRTRSWTPPSRPAPTTSSPTRKATPSLRLREPRRSVQGARSRRSAKPSRSRSIWKPQNNIPVDEDARSR